MHVGPSVGPGEGSHGLVIESEWLAVFVIWLWADNEGAAILTRFLDLGSRQLLPVGLVNNIYRGNIRARNSIRARRVFLSVGVDVQRDQALRVGVRDVCFAGDFGLGLDHLGKGLRI